MVRSFGIGRVGIQLVSSDSTGEGGVRRRAAAACGCRHTSSRGRGGRQAAHHVRGAVAGDLPSSSSRWDFQPRGIPARPLCCAGVARPSWRHDWPGVNSRQSLQTQALCMTKRTPLPAAIFSQAWRFTLWRCRARLRLTWLRQSANLQVEQQSSACTAAYTSLRRHDPSAVCI
jgi:hypothetical protein